jgi:hypothetical protein
MLLRDEDIQRFKIALRLDLNRNQIFNFQIEWISDEDDDG